MINLLLSRRKIIKGRRLSSEYQEVEYIESDGNSYINTGYILQSFNTFEIYTELLANKLSASSATYGWGGIDSGDGGKSRMCLYLYGTNNSFSIGIDNDYTGNHNLGYHFTINKWYSIHIHMDVDTNKTTLSANNYFTNGVMWYNGQIKVKDHYLLVDIELMHIHSMENSNNLQLNKIIN